MARLGEKISALRYERGLSVKALASEAGVAPTTLLRLEHGDGRPFPDTLKAVVSALHRAAPLSREEVGEIAADSNMAVGALLYFLERLQPVEQPMPQDQDRDRWVRRVHELAERILDAAPTPEQAEVALHAMVSAFEAMPKPDQAQRPPRRASG